jgi:hypothetical protein
MSSQRDPRLIYPDLSSYEQQQNVQPGNVVAPIERDDIEISAPEPVKKDDALSKKITD